MIKQFIYKIKSAISNQIILLLLITVLLIILGIACTELGNSYETNNKIISYIFTVVSSIFSACASITGVSAIWELIGKKIFTNELYQRFNISMSLVNSGISEVFYNEENLSWDKELQKTKELEIFSCGDSSWIDNHKKTILDFLEKKGKTIFYLPDPGDNKIMEELDRRHNKPNGTFKRSIEDVLTNINNYFFDSYSSNIEIKFYRKTLCSVYYIIHKEDETIAYFKPYRNSMSKNVRFPIIKVNDKGNLYRFIRNDVDNIQTFDKPSTH